MNETLLTYLHQTIIPIYRAFDQAHQPDHVKKVISNAMDITKDYDVNPDMVYVIACYHDIGMQYGREDHHLTGGFFLYEDAFLRSYFSDEERKVMKEAIEDHRASDDTPPRSIYGMIIAEADRDIDPDIVFLRTVQFGIKHYPELDEDKHFEKAYQHIQEKYGPHGYLKCWLKTKKNEAGLKRIHDYLSNKEMMRQKILGLYRENLKIMLYKD